MHFSSRPQYHQNSHVEETSAYPIYQIKWLFHSPHEKHFLSCFSILMSCVHWVVIFFLYTMCKTKQSIRKSSHVTEIMHKSLMTNHKTYKSIYFRLSLKIDVVSRSHVIINFKANLKRIFHFICRHMCDNRKILKNYIWDCNVRNLSWRAKEFCLIYFELSVINYVYKNILVYLSIPIWFLKYLQLMVAKCEFNRYFLKFKIS